MFSATLRDVRAVTKIPVLEQRTAGSRWLTDLPGVPSHAGRDGNLGRSPSKTDTLSISLHPWVTLLSAFPQGFPGDIGPPGDNGPEGTKVSPCPGSLQSKLPALREETTGLWGWLPGLELLGVLPASDGRGGAASETSFCSLLTRVSLELEACRDPVGSWGPR